MILIYDMRHLGVSSSSWGYPHDGKLQMLQGWLRRKVGFPAFDHVSRAISKRKTKVHVIYHQSLGRFQYCCADLWSLLSIASSQIRYYKLQVESQPNSPRKSSHPRQDPPFQVDPAPSSAQRGATSSDVFAVQLLEWGDSLAPRFHLELRNLVISCYIMLYLVISVICYRKKTYTIQILYDIWLVVWVPFLAYFPINIGLLSSSQLTNSIIFQRGFSPTTNQMLYHII